MGVIGSHLGVHFLGLPSLKLLSWHGCFGKLQLVMKNTKHQGQTALGALMSVGYGMYDIARTHQPRNQYEQQQQERVEYKPSLGRASFFYQGS